jgi:hypothetical protein
MTTSLQLARCTLQYTSPTGQNMCPECPRARSLRHFMGRKHGVGKKEPGGLAPCSICGAVIDPTLWQVPVHGESSWFLPVCQEGSTVPFSSHHRRWGGGAAAMLGSLLPDSGKLRQKAKI